MTKISALLLLSSAALLATQATANQRVNGHHVFIQDEGQNQALVIDGMQLIKAQAINFHEIATVSGRTVLIGALVRGNATCNNAPFIVVLNKAEQARAIGPIETCVDTSYEVYPQSVVFKSGQNAGYQNNSWTWSFENGIQVGGAEPNQLQAAPVQPVYTQPEQINSGAMQVAGVAASGIASQPFGQPGMMMQPNVPYQQPTINAPYQDNMAYAQTQQPQAYAMAQPPRDEGWTAVEKKSLSTPTDVFLNDEIDAQIKTLLGKEYQNFQIILSGEGKGDYNAGSYVGHACTPEKCADQEALILLHKDSKKVFAQYRISGKKARVFPAIKHWPKDMRYQLK